MLQLTATVAAKWDICTEYLRRERHTGEEGKQGGRRIVCVCVSAPFPNLPAPHKYFRCSHTRTSTHTHTCCRNWCVLPLCHCHCSFPIGLAQLPTPGDSCFCICVRLSVRVCVCVGGYIVLSMVHASMVSIISIVFSNKWVKQKWYLASFLYKALLLLA